MKLDLSEIIRTPGAHAEVDINERMKDVEGMTLFTPIRGRMSVSSTGRVLLIEGAIDAEIEQVCGRCGDVYHQPVHAEFQEDFVVRPAQSTGQGPRIEEEDEAPEAHLFYEGTLDLNLDELLRQSLLVALPLKPLCSEDCQGLCPRCGHQLSEGQCSCQTDTTESHLSVLKTFFEQRQREG